MSHALQELFEKCASLLFEIEAFMDGADGGFIRRPAGSGMFFAPCQALTAKHVVNDMHNVNPARADHVRRQSEGFSWLPYFASASQIVNPRSPGRAADWGCTNIWQVEVSDIAIIQLAPIDQDAREMMDRMRLLFPSWSLLPPPKGATVAMLGQPRDASGADGTVADTLTYICQPAVVTEHFETRHDRGLYNFPCFTVDSEVAHGMSGGPVFWEDRFCGIVSGGLGTQTVIASLWPLCLTHIANPKLGSLGTPTTFASLLDSGQIRAVDWHLVKGQVSFGMEDGRPVPLLRPPTVEPTEPNEPIEPLEPI